jgi:hypothetical protein
MHLLGSSADVSAVALTNAADDDAGTDDAGVSEVVKSCVTYSKLDDGRLRIVATNFSAACGIMRWQGGSHLQDGTLVVQSQNANRDCSIAACGSCIYDFTYEVAVDSFDAALPLRIEVGQCADGDAVNRRVTTLELPLDAADAGTLCRDAAGGWR